MAKGETGPLQRLLRGVGRNDWNRRFPRGTGALLRGINTVGLFASQDVIKQLHAYQEITRLPYAEVSRDEHDRRLTDLVLAVRRDLRLRPDDDSSTFSFHMIAPYRNGNAAEQIVGRDRR